jgi:hypothetical protein
MKQEHIEVKDEWLIPQKKPWSTNKKIAVTVACLIVFYWVCNISFSTHCRTPFQYHSQETTMILVQNFPIPGYATFCSDAGCKITHHTILADMAYTMQCIPLE